MKRRRKQPKKETKFMPNDTQKETLSTNNESKKSESAPKNTPQMKKPQETNQEQENENINKRPRDLTSPTKNNQNKKIKEHTNQIPVLGSTGKGFQDAPSGKTNFCGQQHERDSRALLRDRRIPLSYHSQDRNNDIYCRGSDPRKRTYLDAYGKTRKC